MNFRVGSRNPVIFKTINSMKQQSTTVSSYYLVSVTKSFILNVA